MIMHGTWYKGPQLAHHTRTDYAQFRSYPSFVVTPYHQSHHPDAGSIASSNNSHNNSSINSSATTSILSVTNGNGAPIYVEGTFTGVNQLPAQITSVLSPTIKIEQGFGDPTTTTTTTSTTTPLRVEEYGLNLDCSAVESTFRKPAGYVWPVNSSAVNAINNNASITLTASTPPTPTPSESNLNLENANQQNFEKFENHIKSSSEIDGIVPAASSSSTNTAVTPPILTTAQRSSNNHKNHTHGALQQNPTMPIGGVQSQNPTQGLVHWMSAVMAEHMTGQTHHDPTGIGGMHYMWNGNVDCGQHSKEIGDYNSWPPTPRNHMSMKQGYEAKMNDHHSNLQKGHFLDDNRLDHHQTVGPQGSGLIGSSMVGNGSGGGAGGGLHHSNHLSGHHSSAAVAAASAALLVVPQPINATKIGASLGGGGAGGTGRKYQCKMCPQIFSSKADLQLHTQIHMREAKPYKCTQCSKAFANSSYLSQHTRIHLGIKPYRCEICQRKFTQLSHLQQHIRTHTGDKPYKCRHPGCQKAFSQLSNLQSHSRCHQTDKPFKCNSCYKCFSDEPSLLEHIPKHKESKHLKTHICQYCGKSYTQETYLTKHMQKHAERTDKRPPIVAANAGANPGGGGAPGGGGGGGGGGSTGSNSTNSNGVGIPGAQASSSSANGSTVGGQANAQHNRNNNLGLPPPPPVSIAPSEHHSYWPKVSPDSAAAANMADVMQHQQQQQQQHHHHQQQQQSHPSVAQQQHQQQQQQQHMDFSGVNTHQGSTSGSGAGPQNGHPADLQSSHHRMGDGGREDMVSTPSTVGPYDASSITKTTSNSAFTPINSMPPHLNSLGHHPMSQRPYLYDAISFQNKNINQNNGAPATFPNQLISLHQIRNYAHQPAGLMAGEHLLGVSVGPGKEKG